MNLYRDYPNIFQYLCKKGYLSLAQWLLSVKPNIIISARNEEAFRYACGNGHLSVAQWLLSVEPTINISAYNEQAFMYACGRGHLLVAQWLLSVKPNINISAGYDEAFKYACKNGHLSVAEWLQSLNHQKYVISYNKEMKIISYKINIIIPKYDEILHVNETELVDCSFCYEVKCNHIFCEDCLKYISNSKVYSITQILI